MQEAVSTAVGKIYQEVLASPRLLQSATEAARSLASEEEQFAKAVARAQALPFNPGASSGGKATGYQITRIDLQRA